MKKLIAIDIDGTLAHDNGLISDYSKEVIKELTTLGHVVVICTARPKYHALKITEELGLRYFICLSGALVYDTLNKETIFESFIDKEQAKKAFDYSKIHNVRIVFSGKYEYVTKFKRNENQVLVDNFDFEQESVREFMFIDEDYDSLYKCYLSILELGLNVVTYSFSGEYPYFIILNQGVNKGFGLNKFSCNLKFKLEDIISFGNDDNDISMFESSGVSVAVKNSTDDLKKVAKIVIESNNDDSVAKYLEDLLIKK